MRKLTGFLILLMVCAVQPAFSEPSPAAPSTPTKPAPIKGFIDGPDKTLPGAFKATFPPGTIIDRTSVFEVRHSDKALGQCMTLSVNKNEVVVLPKADFAGKPAPKDEIIFVRLAGDVPGGSASGGGTDGYSGSSTGSANKTVHVSGYTKKDGTYVAPYDRSAPGTKTK